MARFKYLSPMITDILETNPATRSDNFVLYVEVLKHFIDTDISLKDVFLNHKHLGIPSLESITRCRRKIQEKNPDLRDLKAVEIRAKEQEEYRAYAREV